MFPAASASGSYPTASATSASGSYPTASAASASGSYPTASAASASGSYPTASAASASGSYPIASTTSASGSYAIASIASPFRCRLAASAATNSAAPFTCTISNVSPAMAIDPSFSASSSSDSRFVSEVLPLCPVCGIASAKLCFDCEQQFCANHIYSCADCGNQYCGDCLDAHHADGHWTDSDTALELASAHRIACSSPANTALELASVRRVVRSSHANVIDLPDSVPALESISPLEIAISDQPRSSWPAIQDKIKSLLLFLFQCLPAAAEAHTFFSITSSATFLLQRLRRLISSFSFVLQNVALQLEARS